ncbi:hypothetical protein FH965_22555 [Streptomyces spectabilis]|uniref:Uncharacterized protein n=1 Tax=Streptomyces spectabilis TaxID=68270 RepID=A0A516RBI1_STRST|nr:hypothetical protein FH965_22555 [Streptomyces spectabilis]
MTVGEVTDTMIGLRGKARAPWKSSRVEICSAVVDWARGPTAWVPGVPGGESTGEMRRRARPLSSGRRTGRGGTAREAGAAGWG